MDGGASSAIMVQLYVIDVLYLQYFNKNILDVEEINLERRKLYPPNYYGKYSNEQ